MTIDEDVLNVALEAARNHYKAAQLATFADLKARFPSAEFDDLHHAASRAMALYLAALNAAKRVWAKELGMDKAAEILDKQFPEFSAETKRRAFSEAYVYTR